ncbi:MAG: hypothetical protein ABI054_11775 [Planctomycetota bacterium]
MFSPSIARALSGAFAGLFLFAACNGSDHHSNPGPGKTDFIVTDATVDELLAFQTTIQGLRMVDSTGVQGSNLLVAPLTIELIGASAAPRWVLREELPVGTFRGVALDLTPASTQAIDRSASSIAVTEVATSFEVFFPSPVTITATGYRQLVLDVDLPLSLSGTVATPPLLFDPTGTASVTLGGTASSVIDEVHGTVLTTSAASSRLSIVAFADGDLSLPLGETTINLTAGTLLIDEAGLPFASTAAFYGALVAGTTVLEVDGTLTGGVIVASRIEVEDDGVGSPANVVKIDGRITNLDTAADTFDIEIIEVEKGLATAGPIIGGANSISVTYDISTGIVINGNTPTTETSLADGQRVKVKFPTFAASPFPASQIEIEEQPEFEGVITDVTGLPGSVIIHLNANEPAIASGQVLDDQTDVIVDLAGAPAFLDTEGNPVLLTSQLQPGLKIEVHGAITGPNTAPTITSTRTKVHSGRFTGDVTATFPLLHSFSATITNLKDSFGNSVALGPVTVNIAPTTIFSGEALTEAEFNGLFATLGVGETLEVEVFGLGTVTTPNEILAYEIKAKVN